jgi:hypothetical protein
MPIVDDVQLERNLFALAHVLLRIVVSANPKDV